MQYSQASETKPSVSVIIPTHNRANLVARAIRSVLRQTYQNFEIIVVDDASTDNTKDVIKNFCDERISYIRQKVNKGAPAARNRGIRAARGKYIAFLDSDDEWFPEKLHKQVSFFEELPMTIGVVYAGVVYIKNDIIEVEIKVPQMNGDIHQHIIFTNCVGPLSSGIVRRECLETCGLFDERLPSCQDWDIYIRIAKKYHFAFLKDLLVYHHAAADRITTNAEAKATGHRMILEKYFEEVVKNRKGHSNHRFLIAQYLTRSGQTKEGRLEFLKAISIYPFRPKYYLYLWCSLFGSDMYLKFASLKDSLTS